MYTVDRDGDGVLDSEDDGIEPFGFGFTEVLPDDSGETSFYSKLRRAIESAAECRMTCRVALQYLFSLRDCQQVDPADVTRQLLPNLQLSTQVRESVGGLAQQKVWLEQIVADVVSSTTIDHS